MNDFTKDELVRNIEYQANQINIDKLVKQALRHSHFGVGIGVREIDDLLFICEVARERVNAFNKFLVELKIIISSRGLGK
jgi:predicted RNA-binding Zn ribbon-like protein